VWGVTGRITVTFRRPVPVGVELVVTGGVTKETRRAIETHGEVRDAAGALFAEADALFLVMPEDQRRELERRYSRIDEAFAKVRAAVDAEEAQREHTKQEHVRT
jgi:acyl-CoA thioesterase FadM